MLKMKRIVKMRIISIPAMEFYAESDGFAYIIAGQEMAQSFVVPTGEWFEVKHLIDINNGIATFQLMEKKYMFGHLFIKIAVSKME